MRKILMSAFLAIAGAISSAQAATSDWVEVHGGAVRLISSNVLEGGHYLAGLEFLLEPGWHTYWRYPGEAGIPPQITLTGAENVRSHKVLYPVPERYSDGFSDSIVYHDGIVLPITVEPVDPDRPVRLAIDLFFGICKDICVPGEAQLTLDLVPEDGRNELAEKLIRRDLAAVPGPPAANGLAIERMALSPADDGFLEITVTVPNGRDHNLFAAGPDGSFIGLPERVSFNGDTAIWRLSTKGLRTTAPDQTLILVLTDGSSAVEHRETVDTSWVR